MSSSSSLSHLVAACVLAGVTASCGGVEGLQVIHEGPPVPLEALAVERVDYRLRTATSWDRWEKLRDVLAEIHKRNGLDAIAPWEFHVIRAPASPAGYLTKSDLELRAKGWGIPVSRVGVLHASVEEQVYDQTIVLEDKGYETGRAGRFGSHILVRLELIHPSSDRVLARFQQAIVEDRYRDVSDHDPRPQATAALRNSVAVFLEALVDEEVIVEQAPPDPIARPAVAESLTAVLDHRAGGPTLREHLRTLDPILRTAMLYSRFRYFEPEMSLTTFQNRSKLPPGLILKSKQWGTGKRSDLIVCANAHAMHYRFQWVRAWRRGTPKRPTILRPGSLNIDWSADSKRPSSSALCP